MNVIHAESVNHALSEALYRMLHGETSIENSRNGSVLVLDAPVTTTYHRPMNRVLFGKIRNANPFFHMMESLWMLAGRNDLAFVERFNKRFKEYSDDGKYIWGAYGWRWRRFFEYDQLELIIKELERNPTSRRCVLTMWNAAACLNYDMDRAGRLDVGGPPANSDSDLQIGCEGGKDVPCNTHAYIDVRGGKVNMTVCCRSNDAIWGAYGANAVHFSFLLEYIAMRLNKGVGVYRQISNNMHVYLDVVKQITKQSDWRRGLETLAGEAAGWDFYAPPHALVTEPMLQDIESVEDWNTDFNRFMRGDGIWNEAGWRTKFFGQTVRLMYMAHAEWREKQYQRAYETSSRIADTSWRIACAGWTSRFIKE